jgi:hypothetical protein
VQQRGPEIIVQLAGVEFIDSSGVGSTSAASRGTALAADMRHDAKRDDDEAVQRSAEREDHAGHATLPRVPGSEKGRGRSDRGEVCNRECDAIELIVLDDAANHGYSLQCLMRR